MAIQLPPLSPSEPVRTQVIPPGRPCGRWRAAAYGSRVGGPDPADTPTNGGSRGAAPPGNLRNNDGQRPRIHRLQRCRWPKGPRTSVTVARNATQAFLKQHRPRSGQRTNVSGVTGASTRNTPNTSDAAQRQGRIDTVRGVDRTAVVGGCPRSQSEARQTDLCATGHSEATYLAGKVGGGLGGYRVPPSAAWVGSERQVFQSRQAAVGWVPSSLVVDYSL